MNSSYQLKNKLDREELGKIVRKVWVTWAITQPDCKESWVIPWEDLSERDKEVDRQIGEAVAEYVVTTCNSCSDNYFRS